MSKRLFEIGLLTEVDRAALAAYCTAWARYVLAEEEIARLQDSDTEFLVNRTESGYEQPSVWLQISDRALKQMKTFMTEFGMTPSSRSKVAVVKEEEENPFDKFLGRRAA